MLARRRLDGTETAPICVPYYVTREQLAALLLYSTRWRPGASARYGQKCAIDVLAADPTSPERPLPAPGHPRYRDFQAALADVDRWGIYGRQGAVAG